MNGKKNILRKQIAFISAISFLSANFVPMGAIAAETTTQPTSSAITETTVTTTESTTQSTTSGITDEDAAVSGETVVHIGNSEFSGVEDHAIDIAEAIKGANIPNVTSVKHQKNANDDSKYEIVIEYEATEKTEDEILSNIFAKVQDITCYKELYDSLFVTNFSLYKEADTKKEYLVSNAVEYYQVDVNISCFDGNGELLKSENTVTYGENQYVRKNTDITADSFNLKKFYYLTDLDTNTTIDKADGKITFNNYNRIISINGKNKYQINNSRFKIEIKSNKHVKLNYDYRDVYGSIDIEEDWNDASKKQISIFPSDSNKYSNKFKINDEIVELSNNNTMTLQKFLEYAGYSIRAASCDNNDVFEIDIEAVPKTSTASRVLINADGEKSKTETIDFELDSDQNITIPYIIEKDEKIYFLSLVDHKKNADPQLLSFYDVINQIGSSSQLKLNWNDIEKLDIEYKEISSDDETTSVLASKITGDIGNQRSDDVVCLQSDSGTVMIDVGEEYEGFTFVFRNEEGSLVKSTVSKGTLPITAAASLDETQETSKFYKFMFMYNQSEVNEEVIPVALPQLVVYYDADAPDASFVGNNEDKWSADACKFTINLNDDEKSIHTSKDEISNVITAINKDTELNSIAKISIAGIAIDKPESGWKANEAVTKSNNKYIVSAIAKADENGCLNGNFDVSVSLADADNMGIDEDISIYAVDNCENQGNTITKKVKIDRGIPQLDSLAVEKLINGKYLEHNSNLKISIEANDAYPVGELEATDESSILEAAELIKGKYALASSGIAEIKYYFNTKEIKNGNNEKNSVEFNLQGENCSSIITIVVKDNAGNEGRYYYYADGNGQFTGDIAKATVVVVDNDAPEKPEIKTNLLDTQDPNDWINYYPEVYVTVSDKGKSPSGLNTITVKVNDVSYTVSSEELGENAALLLEKGSFTIVFVPQEDPTSFIPYLRSDEDETLNVQLSEKPISLKEVYEKGKLNVEIGTSDIAGNTSEKSNISFKIDNTVPVVTPEFEKADPNDKIIKQKSFGTFANDKIKIKVKVSDESLNAPSSGFESAVLNFKRKIGDKEETLTFPTNEIKDNYAVFEVPNELEDGKSFTGTFSMVVTDKAKNSSDETALFSAEGKSANVILERVAPAISDPVIVGENRFEKKVKDGSEDKTEFWFSSDVNITYTFSDADSGIEYAKIESSVGNESPVQAGGYKGIITDETLSSSTKEGTDGKYTFNAYVSDNAGNGNNASIDVYKDIYAPYVDGFRFNPIDEEKNISDRFAELFEHFYTNSKDMEVAVRDDNGASSGISSIAVQLYNTDGSIYGEKTYYWDKGEITFKDGAYRVIYPVDEGFKGDIKAWAVDNVQNKSEESSPDGYVSENDDRHKNTSALTIKLPETQHSDREGLPLYANNITAEISAADVYSGIKRIEWLTSDMNEWSSVDVSDNRLSGNSENWNIVNSERNITTEMKKEITVSKDANNNYIRVRMIDNSGNVSEKEIYFSIDKKVPVIDVSGITPSNETQYFNTHKNIQVMISERNFDSPDVNGSKDSGYTDNTNTPRNSDEHRHSKEYAFNSDGSYNINISDTDLAGNKSAEFASGTFVVDTIAPKASIVVTDENGKIIDTKDSPYISGNVRASVNIEELNFNPDTVEIRVNGEKYAPSGWTGSNVHTASIASNTISNDGSYTITVSGKDRAGNELQPVTVSFTVDKKQPVIDIGGVSKANKGDVEPVVNIYDDNLSSQDVKVYRNGKLCDITIDNNGNTVKYDVSGKGNYVSGRWSTENLDKNVKKKLIFDNFPKEEIFDASYKIEVSTKDKAENSSRDDIEFSVNRFGSVFSIENADELEGRYLNKAPQVVITERNVDMHDENSEIVIIVDKGSQTVKLSEKEYEVSEPVKLDDNSGYEYKYTIKPENFEQDLDYSISIQSVDAAGNTNVSSARGAEVSFVIDTHVPEFKCDDLADKAEFRGSEREFRINVNEKLSHIKVSTSLDETLVDKDVHDDENSFVFVVPASNSSREIVVELTDLAGNKTTKKYGNLLVTENVALYALHKTWVKVTGISALAGLGAAGGFLFARKKRRNK